MNVDHATPQGLWLPLVTPFRDGALDEPSVRRLAAHYAAEPVDALIVAATTGEGLTLEPEEVERLIRAISTVLSNGSRTVPIYLGLAGSNTRALVATLQHTAQSPIAGYLISCPYYSRPSQEGLFRHFSTLTDSTDRPILLYNIPYRTGINLSNETTLRLAERRNIVGIKDCSANPAQSFDLLRARPDGFSVLTGEDTIYYDALAQGADGAVLASAHLATSRFSEIRSRWLAGEPVAALEHWRKLVDLPRLLFTELSVAAIKHCLWRTGLIDSPEVRLPLTPVSHDLARRLDREIKRWMPA